MEDIYSASESAPAPDHIVRRPWLITFANLACILLSIFVLLAHSSTVQKDRVEGDTSIRAYVNIDDETVSIVSWQIEL